MLLCWQHHHAIHEGGYSLAMDAGAVTVWRPNGTLLVTESVLVPTGPGIVGQHEALGISIAADTITSKWDGRHPNYSDAVAGLCHLEDRDQREAVASQAPPADSP